MVIKFDLSDIPEDAILEGAVLSLYVYKGYDSWDNGLKTLHEITSSWDESSVTWNSKPSNNSSKIAECNSSSINVWEDYDVTGEVKDIVENSKDNYGFMLIYGDYYTGAHFRSSEYSSTEYRPKLTVTYLGDEAFLEIKSPNGGEEIEQNSTCIIEWADNIDGDVKIELYQNGNFIETIADAIESNGSYDWLVPIGVTPGDGYSIKIISVDSTGLVDESSQPFSILSEVFISEFPYIQNFDNMDTVNSRDLSENWKQLTNDDINWKVHTGPTPSKVGSDPDKTGPDADHTSGNGNYVYIEASDPNNPEKKATIITPKFKISGLVNPEFVIWAHMFSADNQMGDLYVDINVDGTLYNDVIHLTDDHGDDWFEVKQSLSEYQGERVQFIFRGITGTGWCGDICIDDFFIDASTEVTTNVKIPGHCNVTFCGSRINFHLPESDNNTRRHVSMKIYNLQGKMIATLFNGHLCSGHHSVNLDKFNRIGSGAYICKIKTEGYNKSLSIIKQ